MAAKIPLAWRNNNPGNIRFVPAIKWQGQIGVGDGGFVLFATPQHGFRALARQIMTYKERDKLDTVRKILTKWAPPVGYANGKSYTQNTEAYIRKVALDMGVHPDQPLQVQDARVMFSLVKAIADYEDGPRWTWDDETIREGLRMAGFDVGAPPAQRTPEVQVGIAAAIAAILQQIAPYLPAIGSFLDQVGPGVALAAALVVIGAAVLFAYRRRLKLES